MKYLIDTHTFLWFITGDSQLSGHARDLISDLDNHIYLSTGSLWEMAIKTSLGKLKLSGPFENIIPPELDANDFEILPISLNALEILADFPFHHQDPFDRLIIAQAEALDIPVIGKDDAFEQYPIQTIW